MADVTISQLTKGTPAGNNILPYSTGSNTLGVPVSALFQNTNNVAINTQSPYLPAKLHIKNTGSGPGGLGNSIRIENSDETSYTGIDFMNSSGVNQSTIYQVGAQPAFGYVGGANALQIWNRSGATAFGTGNNTSMLITSGGTITKPRQPALAVKPNQHNTYTFYNNSYQKLNLNGVIFNQGNCWDTANQKFIAPVDGIYSFSGMIRVDPNPTSYIYPVFVVNGVENGKNGGALPGLTCAGVFSIFLSSNFHILLNLSKDDEVELKLYIPANATFSIMDQSVLYGYLLG